MRREVIFYRTAAGRCPVEEFLDSLSAKQAQKIAWVLQVVEDLEVVPAQYLQKMTGTADLWEIRVKVASDIFRLLCFFDGPQLLVIAHAFQKKTQKTPKRAIATAEDRKREYVRRKRA